MRWDRDPKRAQWCETLVEGMSRTIRGRTSGRDGEEISVILAIVLQEILNPSLREREGAAGRFGGIYFSMADAGNRLALSRHVLRRYIVTLAQAGIIKGVNVFDRTKGKQFPLEIVVRPEIAAAYRNLRLAEARSFGNAFALMWLKRLDEEGEVQGFLGDAPFGTWRERDSHTGSWIDPPDDAVAAPPIATPKVAAEGAQPLPSGQEIIEKIRAVATGTRATPEAAKREAVAKRREAEEEFVTAAAKVWTLYQERMGYGSAAPSWAGAPGSLGPEQAKNRRALIKAFRLWGGDLAIRAWTFWCAGKTTIDPFDKKPKFKPEDGWKTWTTPERRPVDFDKHLDRLLQIVRRDLQKPDPAWEARFRLLVGDKVLALPATATPPPPAIPSKIRTEPGVGGASYAG